MSNRLPTSFPGWITWLGKWWMLLTVCFAVLVLLLGLEATISSRDEETVILGFGMAVLSPVLVIIYGWPGLVLYATGRIWMKVSQADAE